MLREETLQHLRAALGLPATAPRLRASDSTAPSGARPVETSAGTCLLIEHRYPLHHCHGRVALDDGRQVSSRALAVLARHDGEAPGCLVDAVFLDTETTGLNGGAGTYVFLVGLGRFESDAFVISQYFMREHGEEPALLEAVASVLDRFPIAVTFNGKSFDLPLLETRYTLARRPSIQVRLHVDLLHPARRLWRHRLDTCRLSQLEAVFGYRRESDVPAWMIPSLYFNFVRRREAAALEPVFEHNRCDVLSLAALAIHLGRLLDDPHADGWQAEEVYGAARLLEDNRCLEAAGAAYRHAWKLAAHQPVGQAAIARLATLYKRLGRPDLAVPLWERLAASLSPQAFQSRIELAKYYEHRRRDYAEARRQAQCAQELLSLLELLQPDNTALAAERSALEHRLARLCRAQRRWRVAPGSRAVAGPAASIR